MRVTAQKGTYHARNLALETASISPIMTTDYLYSQWVPVRVEVLRLIVAQDFQAALEILKKVSPPDTKGECDALMANAYFLTERYAEAEQCYTSALSYDEGNRDWQDMRAQARANVIAEVSIHIPPYYLFEREKSKLLAPASGIDDDLPVPLTPRRVIWPERVRRFVGSTLGVLVTLVVDGATWSWGTLAGYRGKIWTNWYRRGVTLGILTLAYMRDRLNKNNLINTYPEGSLTGFQKSGQQPPPGVRFFRTADGSWNNQQTRRRVPRALGF